MNETVDVNIPDSPSFTPKLMVRKLQHYFIASIDRVFIF